MSTHRTQPRRSPRPLTDLACHEVFAPDHVSPRTTIFVRSAQPKPSPVFDTYWRFAAERQAIFHRRTAGASFPWTDDPILTVHKFTNAYRAADRVSQYLIRHVIYSGTFDWRSTVIRILLFKIFNKISTWELIESQAGIITAANFNVARLDRILSRALEGGASIYSGAYIMPSGSAAVRRSRKHEMHLNLLATIADGELHSHLLKARSMETAYRALLALPTFGPFLALQFLIDLNYSEFLGFSEMDFVVPGPGARDGIRKCFVDLGDYSETDTIRWVTERQTEEFRSRNLDFKSLWGRPLQLIDCQNLFCEADKYARVAHPEVKGFSGRTRIKQRFSPQSRPLVPWFPPKWGLNEQIEKDLQIPPGPSRENVRL